VTSGLRVELRGEDYATGTPGSKSVPRSAPKTDLGRLLLLAQ
jgi:hypothetical protein